MLAAVFVALLAVYFVFLYKLQIIEGEKYYEESRNNVVTVSTVIAARGNILDRYGRVIVSNKSSYDLTINESELFPSDESLDSNATILQLVKLIREYGDEYIDELPITEEPPFEYEKDMSSIDKARLQAYMQENKVDENATAVEVMSSMRTRYKIDSNYSAEEARIIAGVRYAINVRYLINTSDYVFVQDADMKLISIIRENNMAGVNVKESFIRGYNTTYAAHILGYVGLMNDEEYAKYSELGYAGDAKVGKEGVEYAFEKYLHGTNGKVQVTSASDGTVVSKDYIDEPQPGNNVYLTIDIALQEATERALANVVTKLMTDRGYDMDELYAPDDKKDDKEEEKKEEEEQPQEEEPNAEPKVDDEITGAGAVVVNVKTGEPLAIASWPTYDASTMLDHYSELLNQRNSPLFNRALQGTYAPGSTFKPCTAMAGLTEKIISTASRIECTGVYTKYAAQGYAPQCWINSSHLTHGYDNVSEALRDSCNIFFYSVGNSLGIDKMDKYAALFGLGESTGIEIYESKGNMSNSANHYQYAGQEWMAGDTLQAAIGQADSIFTPLQLAEYCAAVANSGERHTASILKEARSYDYSTLVVERNNEVLSKVQSPQYNWDAVHQGMTLVAKHPEGSAYATFHDYGTSTVACKTGTAQKGEHITNDGIFICYAPVDDPEIAIAVVIERGGAGANCAPVGREILETYFSIKSATDITETEGVLLK